MAGASSRSTIDAPPATSEDRVLANECEQNHKRIRACIACRNMKIKCVSVPGSKDCETCIRFSRPCQDPGPPKARVKTSQKFSELEKKIDALTSALDAERKRYQQSLKQAREDAEWSRTPDSSSRGDNTSPFIERQDHHPEMVTSDGNGTDNPDVVSRGLVDIHTASMLFNHWNTHMRPLMPSIYFSSGENVNTIRAKKPILFLTIITIASTSVEPSIVHPLLAQLNSVLAQEVFIQGANSLDLLQSLVLFSQYYIQPPHIKAFALPQHIYSAVVMSHDLSLETVLRSNEKGDSEKEKEAYRTLLAVYFGASCSATLLRRHQPLIFSPSYRACMEALTRGSNTWTDDHWLCSLVGLQEIFDDASKTLNASYTCTDESFDDFRTQHLLGIFRQRLADWKLSPSGDLDPRLKNHAVLVAELYIHQVAVRVYGRQIRAWLKIKDNENPNQTPPVFTATHIDALCHCLSAGANALNIYLSLDDTLIRSLPNVFLIWNLCVVVGLLKLGHFAEDLSHSRVNGPNNYNPPSPLDLLEALIQRLTTLSLHGYFPQSRPFIVAFKKLRTWYQQRKIICINSNGGCDDGSAELVHDVLETQTPPASPSPSHSRIHTPVRPQPGYQDPLRNSYDTQADQNSPALMTELQSTTQPNIINWDVGSHAFDPTSKAPTHSTGALNAINSDPVYPPGYFNGSIGDIGFGLDDMKDIDDFMMQTVDGGLWSLL
ncbi:uncharacterized protein F4812DRAFT_409834 [Daldinia caldariorum]|uniref:uncharacterized protein n=1 Tax=Daldinia caldariorum TaxID=326644 RepID=UPI002007E77D|nr:uncharacterized protein F4812DRAFT_409834 [Daldinia caldariorum]KAI1472669.1 hypothetical protein F4812DRAFT_409834 [Daldinia caldariorum]